MFEIFLNFHRKYYMQGLILQEVTYMLNKNEVDIIIDALMKEGYDLYGVVSVFLKAVEINREEVEEIQSSSSLSRS